MDQFSLFVDAGHLLAEGGKLCCGTRTRTGFVCDFPSLLQSLAQFAGSKCRLPLLRTYWYDAAPNAIPSTEQLAIGNLPRVKLRLGRLVGGQQKGVDSLIVRDFMTLARERAVASIFLVAGDEDLREGVVAAQEMGVSVAIIGIASSLPSSNNQAQSLIREADEHFILDRASLSPFFTPARQTQSADPIGTVVIREDGRDEPPATFSVVARQLLTDVLATGRFELAQIVMDRPIIPREIDAALLTLAEHRLGPLRDQQDLRRGLRAAFWRVVGEMEPDRSA